MIDRMIDELYNRIEEDPGLRPMFPRTLTNERMKQHALADFRIRQGALYYIFSACILGDMDVVTHYQVSLLRLLLTHGEDATRIGPGPWVIHPEITDLVLSHGADVNYPLGIMRIIRAVRRSK